MTRKQTYAGPCATCGVPHVESLSDGWYATNGHPRHAYRPTVEDESPVVALARRDERYTVELGGLHATCRTCGASVSNRRGALELHSRYHEDGGAA